MDYSFEYQARRRVLCYYLDQKSSLLIFRFFALEKSTVVAEARNLLPRLMTYFFVGAVFGGTKASCCYNRHSLRVAAKPCFGSTLHQGLLRTWYLLRVRGRIACAL